MAFKIGTKQTTKAVESGYAIQVFVAKDADERLTRRMAQLCERQDLPLIWVDTMDDLGKNCGIDVGAAMAALVADEE